MDIILFLYKPPRREGFRLRQKRRHSRVVLRAACLALTAGLAIPGCGRSDEAASPASAAGTETAAPEAAEAARGAKPGDEVLVIATTTILGDVAENIVGETGTVDTLMAPGQDPHSFEGSAQQVAKLREADLVIANGLGLEEGLGDALRTAKTEGTRLVFLAEEIDPIEFADEHGPLDPHFWMDPLRMAAAVRLIGNELAAVSRVLSSDEWTRRAEAYAAEIEAVDREIETLLAAVPEENRKLVTNHDSFAYFEDRYGFQLVGVIIPGGSTLAEPSARELEELAEEIERERVPALFAETTQPEALADVVADEVGPGVAVVELYSGSLGERGSGAETYIGMIRTNAERIASALTE